MRDLQSTLRNVVFGLAMAIGVANVAHVAQAASCSIRVDCGGYSVYCYCDGTDEAECGEMYDGCYWDCGSSGIGSLEC
jgi:hypothetical protein